MSLLPADFQPNNWFVVCGRGKRLFNHVGNRRLLILCNIHFSKYSASTSALDRSIIVKQVVEAVREGGGFVKKDPRKKRWYEVDDMVARDHVETQFNELLAGYACNSTPHTGNNIKHKRRPSLEGHNCQTPTVPNYWKADPVPETVLLSSDSEGTEPSAQAVCKSSSCVGSSQRNWKDNVPVAQPHQHKCLEVPAFSMKPEWKTKGTDVPPPPLLFQSSREWFYPSSSVSGTGSSQPLPPLILESTSAWSTLFDM